MLEHLVENHMGGYYISNKDADFIERYCERCNDADTILTSWNTEDKNGRVNALLKFFLMDNIKTKQDLYNIALENIYLPTLIKHGKYFLKNNRRVQIESNFEKVGSPRSM